MQCDELKAQLCETLYVDESPLRETLLSTYSILKLEGELRPVTRSETNKPTYCQQVKIPHGCSTVISETLRQSILHIMQRYYQTLSG